ncbi:hypothetical protein [Chitinimonas naiadis]
MSLMFVIEIKAGVDACELASLVSDGRGVVVERGGDCWDVEFDFGMFAVINRVEMDSLVTVGAADFGLDWPVGARVVFHMSSESYELGRVEIRRIVEGIFACLGMECILSFQYEGVYAIAGKTGVQYLEEI